MSNKNSKKSYANFLPEDVKTALPVLMFYLSYLTSAILLGTGHHWLLSIVVALPAVTIAIKDFSIHVLPDVLFGAMLALLWFGIVLSLSLPLP